MVGDKRCKRCGSERQIKQGFNASGSQRYYCKDCHNKYTPEPKKHAYSEEEKRKALQLITDGVTGRGVGRQLNMSKANAYRWSRELAKKGAKILDK